VDLNLYKSRYYIEPPKFISKAPKGYLEIHKKFGKRAYKELLEICSNELCKGGKKFCMMYTLDGEIIEAVDEVDDDCNLIIVSANRDHFKGIINLKDNLSIRELRMDNAIEIKKRFDSLN